ncbi:MAG: hypothetical protein IAE77_15970 [Prosthecobacter sp.]|jgi:hypothetical protein|uniref:hypothetical protein n=1 Tax=Prosthecobacter sp. TaxID=1965333 RepID=UPI001A10175D|nr:hypothetical protein [Prosthecobacter sp.]MBE2284958.1 hypothetical protein [Prosthecobacter sp.]
MNPQAPEESPPSQRLIEQQHPRVPRENPPAMPDDLRREWQAHFRRVPPRFITWSRVAMAEAGIAAVLVLSFMIRDTPPEAANDPLQEALLSYQEPDDSISPLTRELLHYRVEP